MTDAPLIANIDQINPDTARRAFSNTSHFPEQRGEQIRKDYADAINGLYKELWPLATTEHQKATLDQEMHRYRDGYYQRITDYLHSHSRLASAFVVGPARFPVDQMQKRGQSTDNKLTELVDWSRRARTSIKEKLLEMRPQEEKDADAWRGLEADLRSSLETISEIDEGNSPYSRPLFVSSIVGKVERLAMNGETALVENALALVTDYNAHHPKPAITARHKFWTFPDLAQESAKKHDAKADKPQEKLAEVNGVELWANYGLDRAQLVFPGKPDNQVREKLKRCGWKWAPSQDAWQRQLTNAAIESGKAFLHGLSPAHETNHDGPAI
ncbi:hypothetical protein BH10PLA2_BH10PLA2_08380 [soil metagenome]